jgi:hypothetical protein
MSEKDASFSREVNHRAAALFWLCGDAKIAPEKISLKSAGFAATICVHFATVGVQALAWPAAENE